jgi:nitrogen fixation/metabolism regulation signal transduction histidine kinase
MGHSLVSMAVIESSHQIHKRLPRLFKVSADAPVLFLFFFFFVFFLLLIHSFMCAHTTLHIKLTSCKLVMNFCIKRYSFLYMPINLL